RKTQAEIVSETVRNSARAEYAKFVGELGMNRVDVVVEVYSEGASESCAAQPNVKSERSAEREEERREINDSILWPNCQSKKWGDQDERRAKGDSGEQSTTGTERESQQRARQGATLGLSRSEGEKNRAQRQSESPDYGLIVNGKIPKQQEQGGPEREPDYTRVAQPVTG